MADGRFLSRRGSESHQLAEVSLAAAYLFTWCVPHLDVEGRMPGDPALVKAKAVPLRRDLPDTVIPALLRELVDAGLVLWYTVGGRQYLTFPGFHASQKGLRKDKEAASRIPAPNAKGAALVPTSSVPASELGRTEDGGGTSEEKGREVEVEGKRSAVATQPAGAAPATPDENGTVPHGVLMPLIRTLLYAPDGKPPAGWDEARDGSIVKVLLKAGRSVQDLEAAIRGLRLLVDEPRIWNQDYVADFAAPGAKLTMRMLYNTKLGKEMSSFTAATQAYWKHENYSGRRTDRPSTPQPIAAVLPGVLP